MEANHPTTTVDELLKIPFTRRTTEDKVRIISEGRPKPLLKISNLIDPRESGCIMMDFNVSMYDETQWMTGCPKRNKLYCWPCLLFAKKHCLWQHTGGYGVINLIEKKSDHENTAGHMEAMITLQVFMDSKWMKDSKSKTIEVSQNENKHREIKKRLIDVCCVAIGQQLPNRCLNTGNVLDVEKITKIMKFLQKYDSINKYLCDDAIALIETSPEIINRVVHALTKVVKLAISKDIQSSQFVSIILSQHNDDRSKPQISTVLRYLKDGKVYERFVGFTNMSNSLTFNCVLQHIHSVAKEYEISEKIRAISFDGAILQAETMITFVNKMKDDLPNCCFVPWYSHGVDHILQQCLSCFSTCGQFIKTMASMQTFLKKNYDTLLEMIHECNIPVILADYQTSLFSGYSTSKFASLQFVNSVKTLRHFFIKLFQLITDNCQKWDSDSLAKTFGFQQYLQKLQTIFLLEVFSRIFDIVSSFSTSLKDDTYDFYNISMHKLIRNLNQMRKEAFSELNDCIKNEIAEQSSLAKMYDKKVNQYNSLFNTITNLIFCDFDCRFNQLDKLKFCSMFHFDAHTSIKQLNLWTLSLNETFKLKFSEMLINNDLQILHKYSERSQIKSVYDFYKFINESNHHQRFNVLTDIAELVLVMPFKPASVVYDMSKLQAIEKWSGNIACVDSYSDVSFLCIESDIFKSIKTSHSFYSETMDFFKLT